MPNEQLDTIRKNLAENPIFPTYANLDQIREIFDNMGNSLPQTMNISDPIISEQKFSGMWVEAKDTEPQRAILYIHGGGFVIGSSKSYHELMSRLAVSANAKALGLDYRRTPENTFPAPIEDIMSAYRWMLESDLEPKQIVIAGDSCGGGLSIAALISIRDEGLPQPACAACLSPWSNLECAGESMKENEELDFLVQQETLLEWAKIYLNGADPRSPLASTIHADLSGLAPVLIQTGGAEMLLTDAVQLEEKLKSAGNQVRLEVWEDMTHNWQMFAPILDKGQEAIDQVGSFIRNQIPD